jgi:GH24 family phage-related lysozyme (muramidase)
MDQLYVEALIGRHEGFSAVRYRDTRGKLTIGEGFNLDAEGAEAICEAHGLDFEALRNGASITEDQSAAIKRDFITVARRAGVADIPNFDSLPDIAQAVVVDMIFEMGPTKFSGFHLMIGALRNGDLVEAARQMKLSDWSGEVPSRADDDVALMLSAAETATS